MKLFWLIVATPLQGSNHYIFSTLHNIKLEFYLPTQIQMVICFENPHYDFLALKISINWIH